MPLLGINAWCTTVEPPNNSHHWGQVLRPLYTEIGPFQSTSRKLQFFSHEEGPIVIQCLLPKLFQTKCMMARLEVLFEFNEFKRQLSLVRSEACEVISRELGRMGVEGDVTVAGELKKGTFLLQKWSSRWNTFIDVVSLEDLQDGERLSVSQPSLSSKKDKPKMEDILSRVKKPSEAERLALSKCFSGGKVSGNAGAFDPSMDYRNKKRPKHTVAKSSKVEVIMLRGFQKMIPKGESRRRLKRKGRVCDISFTRSMTNLQVETCIKKSFKDLKIDKFSLLETDPTGHFLSYSHVKIDGDGVIRRRGALYLCEELPSNSDEDFVLSKEAKELKKSPAVVIDSDSDSDADLPKVDLMGSSSKSSTSPLSQRLPSQQTSLLPQSSIPPQSPPKFDLMESRRLIQEQNDRYAESLKIDQDKEKRVEMQRKLKLKWMPDDKIRDDPKGKQIKIRFQNNSVITVRLETTKSAKNLYEVAFCCGDRDVLKPFSLFTILPRRRIASDDVIANTGSSVLVVQPDESAPDPVDLFSDSLENEECGGEELGAKESVKEEPIICYEIIRKVDNSREKFMLDDIDTHHGMARVFRREYIYKDVMEVYKSNIIDILKEFPFRVQFQLERAFDTGGVCRDLFSAFWEEAYIRHFDGESLLIPALNPTTHVATFPILGTVLAHGFMVCGFLPVKIAFPIIAIMFGGVNTSLPNNILVECFIDYISTAEKDTIKRAIQFQEEEFPSTIRDTLLDVLSRFGCTEMPTPTNIRRLIVDLARHHFLVKQLGMLYTLQSGVPTIYHNFLSKFSVSELFELYKALNATPQAVIDAMDEPVAVNASQERVFGYLKTYIRGCKQEELRLFLRFMTGSSVLTGKKLKVSFNSLSGLGRRPISHTCDSNLELPMNYSSFPEFELEMTNVLRNELSWYMDAV